MSNALSAVRTILNNMITVVKGRASKMFSAGKDLIKGLINGIKNMSAAAVGAITGVVDGVVNKAKSLLKINSPSRVFMGIGEFAGEGLEVGILSMAANVKKAAGKLAAAATPDIQPIDIAGSVAGINRMARSQLQTTVTSELSVRREPSYINIRIGNSEFSTFVGDINNVQNRQTARSRRMPRG
jgi:hypothetical protein